MATTNSEWIVMLVGGRKETGKSISIIESEMRIANGWINQIESGESCPLELVFEYARTIGLDMDLFGSKFAKSVTFDPGWQIKTVNSSSCEFIFDYAGHLASIEIPISSAELRGAINNFISTLNSHKKAKAIALGFNGLLVDLPKVNPAVVWGLITQRLYTNKYSWNPGNLSQGGDLAQSWKRSAGWALEEVVVTRYKQDLHSHGIIISKETKDIQDFSVSLGINESKPDVVLFSESEGKKSWIGALAVKASVAERRDDDVPWAGKVMNSGLIVPYVTMDVKSYPGRAPSVDGEYKQNWNEVGDDNRNAKRSDVEDQGVFSGVFSFNTNTIPTHPDYETPGNRIYSIDWGNSNDELFQFIISNS